MPRKDYARTSLLGSKVFLVLFSNEDLKPAARWNEVIVSEQKSIEKRFDC